MFRITKKAKALLTVCMVALLALTACNGGSKAAKSSGKTQKANPASDFEYDFNTDGKSLHIRKFIGNGSEVVFPAEIEGYPVTIIGAGDGVFEPDGYSSKFTLDEYNSTGTRVLWPAKDTKVNLSVKSAVIPEGIVAINTYAFAKCEGLVSVTLPNTLKLIEREAFAFSSVEKIIIPDSLEYNIGREAFVKCKNLKDVVLPDSLSKIYGDTFKGCNSLTNVNIPAGIEKIGPHAFSGCPLTNLKIPESIESITFFLTSDEEPYSQNGAFSGSQPPLSMRKRLQDLGYEGTF